MQLHDRMLKFQTKCMVVTVRLITVNNVQIVFWIITCSFRRVVIFKHYKYLILIYFHTGGTGMVLNNQGILNTKCSVILIKKWIAEIEDYY